MRDLKQYVDECVNELKDYGIDASKVANCIDWKLSKAKSRYGQYKLLDPYKNSNSKIQMKCLKCGKEIYKSWHDLSHGHGCYCSSQRFGDGSDKRNIKENPIF